MSYVTKQIDAEIVRQLNAGGVGLLPSDTIYGLSCRALDETAVKRLYGLKRREKTKPFIILISKISQIEDLGLISTDASMALRYWPGKLTIICESRSTPQWLHMGTNSLAVRQPANQDLRKLIDKVGPIVSTSANVSGGQPAMTAAEAIEYFGNKLEFYVNIGKLNSRPSTLVRPVFSKLEVIRQGAVKIKKKDLA